MERVAPKPLPDVDLPALNQVGKPLRRVDAFSRCEYGRESYGRDWILVVGELLKDGASC